MRTRAKILIFGLAVIFCTALVAADGEAADRLPCAAEKEANAFNLRNLQSRFMVAALACNQREAYNKFVLRYRPRLASAGDQLLEYFIRIGRGRGSVNKHVTDLANAAGLERAESPRSYCAKTWNLFWALEQAPLELAKMAAANLIASVSRPVACVSIREYDKDSEYSTPDGR
jgi:hypothetical protein